MSLKLISTVQKETIAVDIDEVLLKLINPFLSYYNKKNKTHFSKRNMRSYDLWENFGKTKEFVIKELNGFYASPDFSTLTPLPGAVEGIKLLKEKYFLPVVTSRPPHIKSQTIASLTTFFNGSFNLGVSFVSREEKAGRYEELGVKMIIDDDLKVAKECAERGIETLLVDNYWNQVQGLPKKIQRVGNYKKEEKAWEEIQEILK